MEKGLTGMPWQRVVFSGDDIIGNRFNVLMDAFADLFVISGGPTEAGMFQGPNDICYFSPKAVEIAGAIISRFGGHECSAPRSSEVDLLVGSQSRAGVPFAPEPKSPDGN